MNVFTKVTLKTLRKNRVRTIVTIVGILLATAMLTAVTTFLSSLQQYMIEIAIAEEGDWYVQGFGLPLSKTEELRENEEVTALTVFQELGYALVPGVNDDTFELYRTPYLYIAGIPQGYEEMLPLERNLRAGRMPLNSSELVIPAEAWSSGLERLGLEIGDTITLELGERLIKTEKAGPEAEKEERRLGLGNPLLYDEDGEYTLESMEEELEICETRTYTIVGELNRSFLQDESSAGFYCFTGSDEELPAKGSYSAFLKIRRSSDIYEFTEQEMNGYGAYYNTELLRYLGSSLNRPVMQMLYGLAVILTVLIMVGGISLVYNSFAISVSDRTKQFGLLASTGATPRQLRSMVFREAFLLSAVGIPLGILSGIAGIGVTLFFTGKSFAYLYSSEDVVMRLHVSWPAVAAAAVTAFVTVLISAWIPARRSALVSPMEAIRKSRDVRRDEKAERAAGRNGKRRGPSRLSYRLFGLSGMIAQKHFAREKRQYRITVFSLFISIVLFVSASSFSSYVKNSLFRLQEIPGYDVAVYQQSDARNKEVADEIFGIPGVDRVLAISQFYPEVSAPIDAFTEEYRQEILRLNSLYGEENGPGQEKTDSLLTDAVLVILEEKDYTDWLAELGYDSESEKAPEAVALNGMDAYDSEEERYRNIPILKKEGTEVELILTDYKSYNAAAEEAAGTGGDETQVSREEFQTHARLCLEVFAEESPMNIFAGYSGLRILLPQSSFQELFGKGVEDYYGRSDFYLQTEDHQGAANRLEEFFGAMPVEQRGTVVDVKQSMVLERNMLLTVEVFSYGFVALISLIAAANVFNTISTGFGLRKREFAVLSSVGMTPGEMNRMLSFECVFYGLKSLLYGIPVSLLVTWRIYAVVVESMDTSFYVPAASILIAVLSVFLVMFSTMLYARGKMKRENIMDSIRQESL